MLPENRDSGSRAAQLSLVRCIPSDPGCRSVDEPDNPGLAAPVVVPHCKIPCPCYSTSPYFRPGA